jgi:hypothetical protein
MRFHRARLTADGDVMHYDLDVHELIQTRAHPVIAFVLGKRPADIGETDFPLRVGMRHPSAVMGMLEQHVLDGAIGSLKLMGASDFNQLARLGESCKVRFLRYRKAHSRLPYQEQDSWASLV